MTNAVAFKHLNLHALYFSCICAQWLRMPNNARPTEPRYTCDSLLQNQDPMERGMHNRTIHSVIGTTGCALLLVKKWYSGCQVRQQWQKSAQELKLTHEVHMRTLSTCAQMAYAYQYQTNSTYGMNICVDSINIPWNAAWQLRSPLTMSLRLWVIHHWYTQKIR